MPFLSKHADSPPPGRWRNKFVEGVVITSMKSAKVTGYRRRQFLRGVPVVALYIHVLMGGVGKLRDYANWAFLRDLRRSAYCLQ